MRSVLGFEMDTESKDLAIQHWVGSSGPKGKRFWLDSEVLLSVSMIVLSICGVIVEVVVFEVYR